LERQVQAGLQPDVTLLLDAPIEVGMARAGKRGELDRFESEEHAFFERVRQCYLERARREPERFRVINTDRSLDAIGQELEDILLQVRAQHAHV
jgi:dTMP kinase